MKLLKQILVFSLMLCKSTGFSQQIIGNISNLKAKPGDVITIAGAPETSNYYDRVNILNNVIYFGGVKAEVVAISSQFGTDQIVVKVPKGATPGPVSALNLSKPNLGIAFTNQFFTPTFSTVKGEANLSNLNFLNYKRFSIGSNIIDLEVADLDLDQKPELVATTFGNTTTPGMMVVNILKNSSKTNSVSYENQLVSIGIEGITYSQKVDIGDLDLNGLPDLAILSSGYDLLSNSTINKFSILKNLST